MAMGLPTMLGVAVAGLNAVLLGALSVVWLGNYRRFRSPMVLGLVGFSVALLAENVIALAFFFGRMGRLYSVDPFLGQLVLGMRFLTFGAVGALAAVTLR